MGHSLQRAPAPSSSWRLPANRMLSRMLVWEGAVGRMERGKDLDLTENKKMSLLRGLAGLHHMEGSGP